jgi:NAD(P)-dependent dehydrogenase (short-subunit alcohol dehydrogenase family)
VTEEADIAALVRHTVERFGRLDVVVNNAGVEGALGPIETHTEANYRATFDANVLGVLLAMMPARRAASADEIAQTILFLASDRARYLTGQRIAVDGGYTAQ